MWGEWESITIWPDGTKTCWSLLGLLITVPDETGYRFNCYDTGPDMPIKHKQSLNVYVPVGCRIDVCWQLMIINMKAAACLRGNEHETGLLANTSLSCIFISSHWIPLSILMVCLYCFTNIKLSTKLK